MDKQTIKTSLTSDGYVKLRFPKTMKLPINKYHIYRVDKVFVGKNVKNNYKYVLLKENFHGSTFTDPNTYTKGKTIIYAIELVTSTTVLNQVNLDRCIAVTVKYIGATPIKTDTLEHSIIYINRQFAFTWQPISNASSYNFYIDGELKASQITDTTYTYELPYSDSKPHEYTIAGVNFWGSGEKSNSISLSSKDGIISRIDGWITYDPKIKKFTEHWNYEDCKKFSTITFLALQNSLALSDQGKVGWSSQYKSQKDCFFTCQDSKLMCGGTLAYTLHVSNGFGNTYFDWQTEIIPDLRPGRDKCQGFLTVISIFGNNYVLIYHYIPCILFVFHLYLCYNYSMNRGDFLCLKFLS